jgi:hypothetical protein
LRAKSKSQKSVSLETRRFFKNLFFFFTSLSFFFSAIHDPELLTGRKGAPTSTTKIFIHTNFHAPFPSMRVLCALLFAALFPAVARSHWPSFPAGAALNAAVSPSPDPRHGDCARFRRFVGASIDHSVVGPFGHAMDFNRWTSACGRVLGFQWQMRLPFGLVLFFFFLSFLFSFP